MPNPNAWTTKLTLLLTSSLTVMSGATVSPSLPAMQQQFEPAIAGKLMSGDMLYTAPDLKLSN
jgi:hypothetical protein